MPAADLPFGHGFPLYSFHVERTEGRFAVARVRDDAHGDYAHMEHLQALVERIVHARKALEEGRARDAKAELDEAHGYLKRTSHTR